MTVVAKAKLFDDETLKPWDLTYRTRFDAFESLYDKSESANQFPILALISENEVGEWRIIYSEMMKLFHLENSQQFLDLTLRPTKVPLFAKSMMMIEPEIVYRNLNVPILILDPISKNDPMPFEQENIRLRNMHQDKITYIAYPNTEHNIHYAHPQKFGEDVTSFLKRMLSFKL